MTPDQIEAAARELCRIRGYEPDVAADYPLAPVGKCWEQMLPEVERFAQVGTAIATAMKQDQATRDKAAEPTEAPPRVLRKRKTSLPTREDFDAAMRKHDGWMDCRHQDTQAIDPVYNNGEVLRCVDCGARKHAGGDWRRP